MSWFISNTKFYSFDCKSDSGIKNLLVAHSSFDGTCLYLRKRNYAYGYEGLAQEYIEHELMHNIQRYFNKVKAD